MAERSISAVAIGQSLGRLRFFSYVRLGRRQGSIQVTTFAYALVDVNIPPKMLETM